MIDSLLVDGVATGRARVSFAMLLPEVPCETTTNGLWHGLTVADSFLNGEAMESGMISGISRFLAMGRVALRRPA
jgi:hypothetical protein